MQEKPAEFAEGQLKRVGMLEALTPDLREKLTRSEGDLVHSFSKKIDGNQVDVDLHFRKSRISDLSFLNKFEMTLQKPGESSSVKQTFYVPPEFKIVNNERGGVVRYDNKYTMKEAYNLLSGRPVFKNLLSKEGQEYQAWVKLEKGNVLQNGNRQLKQYNMNYGFDLDKVLSAYSIKERFNPEYYKSLVESLNRGNLQKVSFVGSDGKEEKLYVSPSITTSSLEVFDVSMKRVSLDALADQKYITDDLAGKLRQLFNKPSEKEVLADKSKVHQDVQKEKEIPVQKEKQARTRRVSKRNKLN